MTTIPRYAKIGVDGSAEKKKKGCSVTFQQVLNNIYALAIIGLFIGLITGGHYSTQSMSRKMDKLNTPIESAVEQFKEILATLPDNQLENTLKQAFELVANLKKLSATAAEIETSSVRNLMTKAENAFASVHGSDVAQFASAAEHANLIMSQVDMTRINALIDIMTKLNPESLNNLVTTTTAIEQRLKDLHEIKINI